MSLQDRWREMKIIPEVAGPERHAVLVERYIETLQARARAAVLGADVRLPRKFYPHAIQAAAQMMNNTLNSVTGLIPYEQVTGVRINIVDHVPAYFGQVALFRVPKSRRGAALPKAEYGLVLGIVREGKAMVKVYLPSTKVIVDRVQFVTVAIPDDVRLQLEEAEEQAEDEADELFPEAEDPDLHGPETPPQDTDEDSDDELYWTDEARSAENDEVAVHEAHKLEFEQLVATNTFELARYADLSHEQRQKVIPAKMLTTLKTNAAGQVTKVKGRLVACGNFSATESEFEISSPTPDLSSIWTLLGLASFRKMKVASCDVKSAFLKADLMGLESFVRLSRKLADSLDEVLTCEREPDGSVVMKLLRPLYGLRESPRLWHEESNRGLKEMGLVQSREDPCIYHMNKTGLVLVAAYVDDFLVISDVESDGEWVIDLIHARWGVSARYANSFDYLGVNIEVSNDGAIDLHQYGLIDKLTRTMGITAGVKTSSVKSLFDHDEGSLLDEKKKTVFLSVVMQIMYVAKRTWPSVLKEVATLAAKASAPTWKDWLDLVHLCSFLYEHRMKRMRIRVTDLSINVYADASFAIHPDAKSHSGVLVFLGSNGCCLYASSKKQKIVTLSSCEAELVAVHEGYMHGLSIKRLLSDFGLEVKLTIMEDNMSTIKLLNDGPSSIKSRHVKIRYFFASQLIKSGEMSITHIRTVDQLADILTKPMDVSGILRLTSMIMNWVEK